MSEVQARELVMERKEVAAQNAATVGEMNTKFRSSTDDLLRNPVPLEEATAQDPLEEISSQSFGEGASTAQDLAPEVLRNEVRKHVEELDKAAEGKEERHLMEADPTRLAQNRVGEGDGPIEHNSAMYTRLDGTGRGVEIINHADEHERAHGKQVDAPLTMLEGHAEVTANEATGMSASEHREGQPREVYGAGQDLILKTTRIIGRDEVEKGMTQDYNGMLRQLMLSDDPEAKNVLREIAASN